MKTKIVLSCLGLTALALCLATKASATIMYNQNVTAIFGSGNPDGGWTTDTSADGKIQVAGRIKDRTTGDTTNVNGVYSSALGVIPSTSLVPYQIEFSLNSNADGHLLGGHLDLTAIDWAFGFDTNPTAAKSMTWFDPLTYQDNAYSDGSALNGGGTVQLGPLPGQNIAQNSENGAFAPFSYDPNVVGTYDFEVFGRLKGSSVNVVDVTFQLNVGADNPVSSVPDGGTTALMLAGGLGALGIFAYRRRDSGSHSLEMIAA